MGHRKAADHDELCRRSADHYQPSPSSGPAPFGGIWDPNTSLPKTNEEGKNDPDAFLRAYGVQLSQTTCGICKVPLLPNRTTAFEHAQKLMEINASGYIACHACGAHTCIGCGMMPRTRRSGELGLCCDNARLFCIWLWLCALETLDATSEDAKALSQHQQIVEPNARVNRHGLAMRKSNGTGYGGNNTYGHNMLYYESDDLPPIAHSSTPHTQARARRHPRINPGASRPNREQVLLPRLFHNLRTLLPDFTLLGSFDKNPPLLLTTMLQRSQVLETVATLLRSDNLDDVVTKFELYDSLLTFMGSIIQHPRLVVLMAGSREFYSAELGRGLLKTTMPHLSESITVEKAQSVTVSMQIFGFKKP
jgi:hypothetical protein